MITSLSSRLATAVIFAFAASGANAALIDNGIITTDTSTGLDWLDLTATNGLSYNHVKSQLNNGGDFDGYRFATSSEVISLWDNFGVNLTEGISPSYFDVLGPDAGVELAASFLGNLYNDYSPAYDYGLLGYTADAGRTGTHLRMGALYYPNGGFTRYFTGLSGSDTSAPAYQGSYLVSGVPVPAAVWLFGSGLGLLGWMRRKA